MDIQIYRYRIGTFIPRFSVVKLLSSQSLIQTFSVRKRSERSPHFMKIRDRSVKSLYLARKEILLFLVTFIMLQDLSYGHQKVIFKQEFPTMFCHRSPMKQSLECQFLFRGKKESPNFLARYVYGNKQYEKGIKNTHLNIRSLANKVTDIKQIISDQKPHIFGLSECELKKVNGWFDEGRLKVPGYDIH